MKNLIIMPSIRELKHWATYEENAINNNFNLNDIHVAIIDENDYELRVKNEKILENVEHSFWGQYERNKWFEDRNLLDYEGLIPQKCHAESSFGLLLAYDEKCYDTIFFMDDDTAATEQDYFGGHINQLGKHNIDVVRCNNYWYNLLSEFYNTPGAYPRGFPYSERRTGIDFLKKGPYSDNIDIVMNQGMWLGQLDLNACDILPYTDGLTQDEKKIYNSKNIVVGENIYTTICSMNLSFKPEVIPAFYQWDDYRFDDIWSGVIIKKIADHLHKGISHGEPFCKHLKEPRSTFKDIAVESNRLEENEFFWKLIDSTELNGKDWTECYYEVAEHLFKKLDIMPSIREYPIKMIQWLDCLEELK